MSTRRIMDYTILEFIQNLNFIPNWLMSFYSLLGHGEFYLIVGVIYLWYVDYKKGIKFSNFVAMTTLITESLKLNIKMERPIGYVKDGYDYGMPSAHSSTAVVFFILFYQLLKKNWLLVVGIVSIITIAISRIYLNAHFPSQVIVGLLLGLLIVLVYKIDKKLITNLLIGVVTLFTLTGLLVYLSNQLGYKNVKHVMQVLGLLIGLNSGAYLYWIQQLNINKQKGFIKVVAFIGILLVYLGIKEFVDVTFDGNVFLLLYLLLHALLAFCFAYVGPLILRKVSR